MYQIHTLIHVRRLTHLGHWEAGGTSSPHLETHYTLLTQKYSLKVTSQEPQSKRIKSETFRRTHYISHKGVLKGQVHYLRKLK